MPVSHRIRDKKRSRAVEPNSNHLRERRHYLPAFRHPRWPCRGMRATRVNKRSGPGLGRRRTLISTAAYDSSPEKPKAFLLKKKELCWWCSAKSRRLAVKCLRDRGLTLTWGVWGESRENPGVFREFRREGRCSRVWSPGTRFLNKRSRPFRRAAFFRDGVLLDRCLPSISLMICAVRVWSWNLTFFAV